MTMDRMWAKAGCGVAVMAMGVVCFGQDTTQLGKEDARLNRAYQQRVSQLRSDPAALLALRVEERKWIAQRDSQCVNDVACLTQDTKAHADYFETQVKQNDPATTASSPIPEELLGRWVVRAVLPAKTVSCWDQKQADALVGTELEYKADSLRWKTTTVRNLGSTTSTVNAAEFAEDNSGMGRDASAVNFGQLGIKAGSVRQIAIGHPDVTIQDGSAAGMMEMPGDTVLVDGRDRLVFAVCNVYFEAGRVGK
jgi:uncharacterized protein YecT (DUF1311 family)